MPRTLRWLALGVVPFIGSCVGHYVPGTKSVTLSTLIQIRENGAFNRFEFVDISEMVKAKSDIGGDAEILKMEITGLSADIKTLPTTNASLLNFTLSVRDPAGNVQTLTENVQVGEDALFPVSVKTAIALVPQKAVDNALDKLKAQLNAFLASNANISMAVGFVGTTTGGRVDADMHAIMTVSVSFRKCVLGPPTAIVSTKADECVTL